MASKVTPWTCPFCNRPQIVTEGQTHSSTQRLRLTTHAFNEYVGLSFAATACSNPECSEITITASFNEGELRATRQGASYAPTRFIEFWSLRPSSRAKPQPDYIPAPLREDYEEACKIRDLSPKASATLSRRCLQGMIRDFCKISKRRLIDEILALKSLVNEGNAPKGVEPETTDAIDHVRSIGNIGAHMEADINIIVDVDPGEAQALIGLVELLFDEWYGARYKREQHLTKIKEIKLHKDGVITAAKAAKATKPKPPKGDEPTST